MANISAIKLPSNITYDLKDKNALEKAYTDTVYEDERDSGYITWRTIPDGASLYIECGSNGYISVTPGGVWIGNQVTNSKSSLSINSNGIHLEHNGKDIYLPANVTGTLTIGTGTSGYLAKWNGTSSLTNGPQLGSSTTTFLRNDGSWATPVGTTYSVVSKTANGLAPQLPNETTTTKFLRQDGSWAVPSYTVNTDTKVNMIQRGATKAYLLGSTTAPTSTNQAVESVAETGVYLETSNSATRLIAPTFVGALTGTASGNLTSSSTLNAAKLSGAIPSAVTATTQASTDNSTKIATTAYVTTAIANLPEPMIFKGSVGTGGTITSLPAAAASNEGWTYKVITALSSPAAKVGDTVISNGSSWVVIPSGDEPSGTVTSITAGAGLNTTSNDTSTDGGTIAGSGTIHLTKSGATAGSYGDSSAQTPGYGSTFKVPYITVDKYGRVTSISEHTVKIPASDNTNTTYTLTNALASHKFTWTLTPSSGSATTTTAELVQGTGITLTDDTSNKKITITNSGVRAVTQGSQNNVKVNTNGTEAQVPVYLDRTHITPISTKTYTGVIATAATDAECHMYYMKVVPDSYTGQWFIRYRVSATINGVTAANGSGFEESEVYISGMRNTYATYRSWNNISNTSYRPYYYHTFYRAKEAGISYGHLLGVSLRYAYNCTTAANTRNVTFEILEYGGCTPSFFDSPLTYANVPGTGTTNYEGNTMSGDRNDTNTNNRIGYTYRKPCAALYRYQILLSRPNGSLLPVNSVDNAPSNTAKTLTTEEFDPLGNIYYYNSTTTRSTSQNIDNNVLYRQILADLRYSFNITNESGKCLTGSQPVYIVATLQSNGMAKLASPALTQSLPSSDDGKLYIYIGNAYPDTYPYRSELVLYPIVYWYKNGAIRQYGGDAATINGKNATASATTGISIAAHGTGTVIGVQSTTTTASKVTLGTAISVPNVTGNTDVTVPIRADSDTTVPKAASSATTVPIKDASATSCDDITAWNAGSGSASLTFTMDTTDTKKLKIAFSHSHGVPSLSYTARSIIGVQSTTTSVTGVSGSTTVRGVKTGDNSTTTASKVTLGTAKSIPNVTAATDVTVPIKNASASTFVTGTTHTVTDNGHTHTI